MRLDYSGFTDRGAREVNEDSLGMLSEGERGCFAVADGLGGHHMGDRASAEAVAAVRDVFYSERLAPAEMVRESFEESQRRVMALQRQSLLLNGIKTTLALVCFDGGAVSWGHIGDTRIYCFRDEEQLWQTLDHSVPQLLAAAGRISQSEIRGHEDRNRLLRAIGGLWEGSSYEVGNTLFMPKPGDAFLLCSDGFWEYIEERDMLRCLKKAGSAANWLEAMKAEVFEKSQNCQCDNRSAVVVLIG